MEDFRNGEAHVELCEGQLIHKIWQLKTEKTYRESELSLELITLVTRQICVR